MCVFDINKMFFFKGPVEVWMMVVFGSMTLFGGVLFQYKLSLIGICQLLLTTAFDQLSPTDAWVKEPSGDLEGSPRWLPMKTFSMTPPQKNQ